MGLMGRVVIGAVVVHCALCVVQVLADEDLHHTNVTEEIEVIGRALHRAGMLFPLLIGISARLAALVPTVFLGVIGIFVFVAFSKKALIISLLALLLSYLDKYKKGRPKIIHIHSSGHHHPEIGAFEFEPSYHHPPHKLLDFHGKKHFRKWPKIDHGPWTTTGPIMDGSFDSYLPQAARRAELYDAPYFIAPYRPNHSHVSIKNSTDVPSPANISVEIPTELQQLIDKTLEADEEDPR